MMMHMWYWFGSNLGDFLFAGYNVSTTWSLICTCLGLAALAILYEGMKLLQIKLHQTSVSYIKRHRPRTSENSTLLSKMAPRAFSTTTAMPCISWTTWTFQVVHWSLQTLLGYILMMAVMTYNVYINIALVLGGGLGYWIFGPKLIQLNMAQFQEKQKIIECDNECAGNVVNRRRQGSTVSMVAEQLVTEATVEVHAPRDA